MYWLIGGLVVALIAVAAMIVERRENE
ncbi:hypothetical protein ACWOE3_12480 [Enterococcus dispar]